MSISPTNTPVKLVKTNKTGLQNTAVTNGCVYFVDDTKELFFDFDSTRVEVKDILILNSDSQRTSILFSPLNKFYFVLDTQKLWLYKDGTWYEITGTVKSVNNTTPDSSGNVTLSIPTVNNSTITFTQGGVTKGSITLNQSSAETIELDAGGGTSTDVQINGTSITSSNVANIVTNTAYNASNNKIATMSDLPTSSDYVTLNTAQTIHAPKAIFGTDTAFGSDTTQKNLLAVISNSNSVAGNWTGRLTVGAKNKTFIIGTYGNICCLGAHSWTNAQQGTGAAWEPVYINPDGDKAVYIGGSPINGKKAMMVIQNVNANTTGTVKINRSTNLTDNFKDAACWGDNISKFNNDSGFTSNIGTVTSVNNETPDASGNVTLTIPTVDQSYSASSTNAQSGVAVASAISGKASSATSLSGYGITDAYTKTEVNSLLASVYRFKGSVQDVQSLSTTGNTTGDVYNVSDTGANYAWTGSDWDKLSETIDLSGYQTSITTTNKLSADLISDGTTNKTVTSTEKSTWSGKQDALVSGTNIKTINSQSILGNGNITVPTTWSGTYTQYTTAYAGGQIAATTICLITNDTDAGEVAAST